MAKRPQTHNSRWTPEQDVQLKNMVAGGFSSAEIANYFGRTISSIYSRKIVLGLKGRKPMGTIRIPSNFPTLTKGDKEGTSNCWQKCVR